MDLKLTNPSILRVMAAEHLQTRIVYEFGDNELLATALTAAHRRDEYSPSFDGNRGLASLGTRVIEMVHTLYTVVMESGTQSKSHCALLNRQVSEKRQGR